MMDDVSMIRWGIIGCGKIAAKWVADLALVDGAHLHGVASRSLVKAQAFAETHAADLAFGSYEELVAHPDIDAVYIATPHTFHYAHTVMALEAGKHVMCEKPMGINLAQVKSMTDLAQHKGLLLMEAVWTHFLPAVTAAKVAIAAGEIGQVSHMRSDFGFMANLAPELRLLNPALGGGALLDIGIYPAYIMLEILGSPSSIVARSTFSDTGIDLHTAVLADFETGQHAYLECSLRVESSCTTTVYGDKGHIVINSRWHETDSYTIVRSGEAETIELPKTGFGYYHEIVAFMAVLRNGGGAESLFSHDDSRRLIGLLDDIRQDIGLTYPAES